MSPVKKASIWVADDTPGDVFFIQPFQTLRQLTARGSSRHLKKFCHQKKPETKKDIFSFQRKLIRKNFLKIKQRVQNAECQRK